MEYNTNTDIIIKRTYIYNFHWFLTIYIYDYMSTLKCVWKSKNMDLYLIIILKNNYKLLWMITYNSIYTYTYTEQVLDTKSVLIIMIK